MPLQPQPLSSPTPEMTRNDKNDERFLSARLRIGSRKRSASLGLAVLSAAYAVLPTAVAAPPIAAAPADGFVKWTEPKEKSFSVEVPRGWKVVGGLVRLAPLDIREFVVAVSPQNNAMVQIGDPGVPTFITVGTADQQMGYGEGQSRNVMGIFTEVYMHFMSATEFNRWYIKNRLSQGINNLQIISENDMPKVAQNMTASARKTAPAGMSPLFSAGTTAFKGIDKESGKLVGGAMMTTTQLMNANNGPYGSVWIASPMVIGGDSQADGNAPPAVLNMLQSAFLRMISTRRENSVWLAKELKRQTQVRQEASARDNAETARKLAQIKNAGERSRFMASHNSTLHNGSMDAFRQRQAMLDESHHQFMNYLGGERDAIDRNGNAVRDQYGDHVTVPNE